MKSLTYLFATLFLLSLIAVFILRLSVIFESILIYLIPLKN